jgi:pimeloyl-ACP methyl ester carboxylesterase
MNEPTRPIRQPTVAPDGSLVAHSVATPKSFTTRALVTVGSRKVIPVIFVPGIMGSNLKARANPAPPKETDIKPGEPVWRAPNGTYDSVVAVGKWTNREPKLRQQILHAESCEVDPDGELDIPDSTRAQDETGTQTYLSKAEMRARGWGEVHSGSYGKLLMELESHLNTTFHMEAPQKRRLSNHWKRVVDCDRSKWGVRSLDPLTDAELEHYATYQYPVYAVGYNWLESCSKSATRLQQRIAEIIDFWAQRKHACTQVILITHSMGGLVARACAKRIPGKIAGVIHGAMPALGAPVAYRRIACGVEPSSPGSVDDNSAESAAFSLMLGRTTMETTAVMATSAGVLELLPNHLYPRPWLHLRTVSTAGGRKTWHDWVNLPHDSPYTMYRDMTAWYRMIDPQLADPASMHRKVGIVNAVSGAIDEAEHFHVQELGSYYHPNTYAFYGCDPSRRTFSRISWIADDKPASGRIALSAASISRGKAKLRVPDGGRCVDVDGCVLTFLPDSQDAAGDGTVPEASGLCTGGVLKRLFATRGYSHQKSYDPDYMVLLTQHLVVKIVQGVV